ncbi:bacillithiol biosynthesis cysteine-adding enzyme BshC [Bacillus methanolicus]|uniref:bacillithiol biosynthesis cysteine-adding enzyme BshC n=1 Tax=Bacillus methanolicus TaxID=1471 RepID=UPI0023802183|nr:bacillithiol biosynthesis cysteine-adding enzyme BshC [Bacillus methanolicus]MDE3838418.1 bacillithiol biosynthesis cysteine-adding enzyme BshC [Bacillus methanolicus]
MEILNLTIPSANRFATDYINQESYMNNFFHYKFNDPFDYTKRLKELQIRNFQREELANYIEAFMERYPSSDAVKRSVEKLRQKNSAVVIGGQQAGILTGPLYTIHKIISIVAFAREKERELGIPVVPVFWIAGEDHDFLEINHVYVSSNQKIEKWSFPERVIEKKMASDIPLNKEICLKWIESIIETYGETIYTNSLLEFLEQSLKHSKTFVDFFAYMIMALFKETGLLLVDSGDRKIRNLEKEIFVRQIKGCIDITQSVLNQQDEIKKQGLKPAIELTSQTANLFYYDPSLQERILLEYNSKEGKFLGKNGAVSFSEEELIHIALTNPEYLSNNVVTRPLTQEWLFPTLAFIGGPGEIAYWAELKTVFERFEIKMPPIVPRLNITLLERSIETDLNDLGIDIKEVLSTGVQRQKELFLADIKDETIESLFLQTKKQLIDQYELIEEHAKHHNKGLIPLLNKNRSFVLKQINFMQRKFEETERLKHEIILRKFDRIETSLKPNGLPQERIWNILYFLNRYGFHLLDELLNLPYQFDGTHKLIKI